VTGPVRDIEALSAVIGDIDSTLNVEQHELKADGTAEGLRTSVVLGQRTD
jgi:hypothetical protein